MTITVPAELEQRLQFTAEKRQTSVDELVRRALEWYLRVEPELMDELDAWQQVRDEAWLTIEGAPS